MHRFDSVHVHRPLQLAAAAVVRDELEEGIGLVSYMFCRQVAISRLHVRRVEKSVDYQTAGVVVRPIMHKVALSSDVCHNRQHHLIADQAHGSAYGLFKRLLLELPVYLRSLLVPPALLLGDSLLRDNVLGQHSFV